MRAITKILVGGVAMTAAAASAPAAAQYYQGYPYSGYGNQYGGNVVGQVLNDVLGNGYGNYGANGQVAVNQCAAAVQARLNGGYGYNNGYGYNGYGNTGARVLGISRVEPRSNGETLIRGVANSGRYSTYGYNNAYDNQSQVDLTWRCRVDYRGYVRSVDINRAEANYGYQGTYNGTYTPHNQDYSQYGYRRY